MGAHGLALASGSWGQKLLVQIDVGASGLVDEHVGLSAESLQREVTPPEIRVLVSGVAQGSPKWPRVFQGR